MMDSTLLRPSKLKNRLGTTSAKYWVVDRERAPQAMGSRVELSDRDTERSFITVFFLGVSPNNIYIYMQDYPSFFFLLKI